MELHLVAGKPIYFPFLSGILEYDCPSCDARCCKGAQLGIGKSRELASLLHISPSLALFAGDAFPSGPLPVIETVLESCWFLDSTNLCRIERAVGRDFKPASCRLFPFNQFRRAGDFIIVMPHFQCPIQVLSEPNPGSRTGHDALAMEMFDTNVPSDGHPAIAHVDGGTWDQSIPLERDIRDIGAAHLRSAEYAPYADVQADMTKEMLGSPRGPRCNTLRARIASFLGHGDGKPSVPAVHDLVALTPYLRIRLAGFPRPQVPSMLTALSVMVGALEAMPGTQLTARSIVHVVERRAPLLVTLSRLMDRPYFTDGFTGENLVRRAHDVGDVLGRVLLCIEENGKSAQSQSLGTLLQSMPEFRPPMSAEAVGTLMRLGRYLNEAVDFLPAV